MAYAPVIFRGRCKGYAVYKLLWRAGTLLVLGCNWALFADDPAYVPGRLLAAHREAIDDAVLTRTWMAHGAVLRRSLPGLRVSVVEVPESSSEAIRESLMRTNLFEYVERDYYARTAAAPNDPSFALQWYLPRIHSLEAWGVTTGSASVVVAVIDSGVDAKHPDLVGKLVPGWNFVKNNADTADLVGHGTTVAGTLAAASNNGIGVAGVSWASLIMPLVAVNQNDYAAYSDIAAAIEYAINSGIRVINISIGGPGDSFTLQKAVDDAWRHDAVIFGSAMNNASSAPHFPAASNHVVAVSATDANDHLAGFSNYGNWISLSAPGTNILTIENGGGYGFGTGTSFASPIAAGVAALCLAINPALTNAALVALLEQTADDLGPPGLDTSFGWGRVNAYRAVMAATPRRPVIKRKPGYWK